MYNVQIKLISYSDFTCATDDFQKSQKNAIFENCIKNLSFEKNQIFDIFKMATSLLPPAFLFYKTFYLKPFIFKNVVFFIFNQTMRK